MCIMKRKPISRALRESLSIREDLLKQASERIAKLPRVRGFSHYVSVLIYRDLQRPLRDWESSLPF